MSDINPTVDPTMVVRIQIDFMPQRGQMRVAWPEIDDIVKFGMLAMAHSMLVEARMKANRNEAGGIVIPRVTQ